MEGVKHETRRQIIINFYQKNLGKGKLYTINFFKTMSVKKLQVYRANLLHFPRCAFGKKEN